MTHLPLLVHINVIEDDDVITSKCSSSLFISKMPNRFALCGRGGDFVFHHGYLWEMKQDNYENTRLKGHISWGYSITLMVMEYDGVNVALTNVASYLASVKSLQTVMKVNILVLKLEYSGRQVIISHGICNARYIANSSLSFTRKDLNDQCYLKTS